MRLKDLEKIEREFRPMSFNDFLIILIAIATIIVALYVSFGESKLLQGVHIVSTTLAPLFFIGAAGLILYAFYYFFWYLPKKILGRKK